MTFPTNAETWDQLVAAQMAGKRKLRVYPLEVDGQRAWLKLAAKNHNNAIARLFHARKIKDAPTLDVEAMHQEAEQLRRYAAKGYHVPQVLHMGAEYMVLSDMGESLQDAMNHADAAKREQIVLAAAHAVRAMHLNGDAHGGAALRNLTQAPQGVGFIDFEEASMMTSVFKSQVADLWQLAFAVSKFDISGQLTAKTLRAYGIWKTRIALSLILLPLVPLCIVLKPGRRHYKRDLWQTIACVDGVIKSYF